MPVGKGRAQQQVLSSVQPGSLQLLTGWISDIIQTEVTKPKPQEQTLAFRGCGNRDICLSNRCFKIAYIVTPK